MQQYHKIKANFSAHSSVLQNGGWGEILHVPFFAIAIIDCNYISPKVFANFVTRSGARDVQRKTSSVIHKYAQGLLRLFF